MNTSKQGSPAMPKYQSVIMSLIERINSDEFAPNDMLPPESELINAYQVSRITVRKALDEMEAQGYIYRKQGKGTFVSQGRVDETRYKRYSAGYSKLIASTGAACERRQLRKEIQPGGRWSEPLGLAPDDPVLFYHRIYYADGAPVFYAKSCLNHRAFQGIENYDFSFVSLSHLVSHVYEGQLYRRDRKVRSTKADEAAGPLEIDAGDPILLLTYTSVIKVENEMIPFEEAEIYARTDIIEINPEYL